MAVPMPTSVTPWIEAAISPWKLRFPQARWAAPQDRHVTLKFLGPTPRRLDGWLHDRLRQVAGATQPFEIHLSGLDAFPSSRRARILWVGIQDASEHLATMVKALESDVALEFAPERRPFTPHVTVARSDPAVEIPSEYTASPASAAVPVREIVLVRSVVGRPSARYEALELFPLGG